MLCVIRQQCLRWLSLLIKSAQHCANDDVLAIVIMYMCSVISWHMASVTLEIYCHSVVGCSLLE